MATCKDCLHYDLCSRRQNSISLDPVKMGYRCLEIKNKADVVRVVRCKDCVFWDVEKTGLVDECVCKMHSVVKVHSRYTNPTDYCSYGERKCNDD